MLRVRSKFILGRIFQNIKENKLLQIIKYNKIIQKKLNISIQSYKEYNQIKIQLIPIKDYSIDDKFINEDIINKPYIHIYFNKDKNEYVSYLSDNKELIFEINIVIDFEVKSLKGFFKNWKGLKEVNIIKCNRKDIIDMSEMFYECKYLDK